MNCSINAVTGSGTDSTAVLDGVTVTGGYAHGSYPNDRGGEMYNSGGSLHLMNVTFAGNTASNGGATATIPLLPGSSAIDMGSDADAPALDPRGLSRFGHDVARSDIGAFESQGFALTKAGGDNQSAMIYTPFATPLRVGVGSLNGEPVNGGVVTFAAPSFGASGSPVASTVTFADGASAQSLTANAVVGSYAVTANTAGAEPVTFSLTDRANTSTTLTSSANPSLVNHALTFTITASVVPPGSGTPGGAMELYETTSLGASARASQVSAQHNLENGGAVLTTSSLTFGTTCSQCTPATRPIMQVARPSMRSKFSTIPAWTFFFLG